MLTILAYMGIAALVFLLLYMIAIRVPILGNALAFLSVFVARPLVKIQGMFEKAAAYCDGVVEKTLRYPPGVTNDTWHGILVIARNIILMVSSIILTADVYNTLQSLSLFFGGAGGVDLPFAFAVPSSLLFALMSALYGSEVIACAGLLPYGSSLFLKPSEKVRKWLGVLCAIGFVLSLVFAVLFWGSRGYYISVDPAIPGVLAILVLSLVGLLVTGASVLSLWGMVIGLTGLTTFVFWLLSCGFHILAACFSFVPSLLDVLALHFSQGRMSVYGEFLGHEPYKPPPSPFPDKNAALQPGHTSVRELPEHAASIDADSDDNVQIFPVLTPALEEKIMNPDKNACLAFVGDFGTKMFTPASQAIERLRATESILSSLYLDLNITHIHTAIPGLLDLSPSYAEKKAALLTSVSEGEAYHTLLIASGDRFVETHLERKASRAVLLCFLHCRQLVEVIDMLEPIKRRYPFCSLVVVTEVSALDLQNKTVQTGLADMQALVAEDIVETILPLDPQSDFAREHGVETQRHCGAHTLISLVNAHKHSLQNRSFVNVLADLHSLSPFTAMSFTSETVAIGNVPKRWGFAHLLPGVAGQTGTGNYGDIVAQVRAAIDRVLTEEDTRAFPAQVQTNTSCVVLSSVPLEVRDSRFPACVRDTALYCGTHYPFATSITVRGNGYPLPYQVQLGGRFRVQASCLYPLQPASLQRMYEGKQIGTKVTPLYPVTTTQEIASSNGHVPVNEPIEKTKTAKATGTTRQKKASDANRRVGRKSTKQAQQ